MALVAGIAGTAATAYGQVQSGLYGAEVARNNATVAKQNAEYSRQAGQQKAAVTSMKGAAQIAKMKTGQAAGNIDVNTGSAVDVQQGEREIAKLDVETVLNNAELQAYGYTVQATNFEAQAQQDEFAGFVGAAGSLLSGASSVMGGMKPMSQPMGTIGTTWAETGRQSAFGSSGPVFG